jgi:hypothetical protein
VYIQREEGKVIVPGDVYIQLGGRINVPDLDFGKHRDSIWENCAQCT